MRRHARLAVLAILSFAAAACMSYESLIKKILPSDVDMFARACIQEAAANDIDGVIARMPAQDRNENLRSGLHQVSAYMQKGGLVKATTVSVQANTFKGSTTYNITYELQYPRAWQVANLVLVKEGDGILLKGFHVNDLADSLAVLNRFTFKGKTTLHYVFFALTVLYLVVVAGSFVVCLLTKKFLKKWLWAVISLLGIVEFSFNWTTGAWAVRPVSIGLKISTFVSPFPYMPSVLVFYLPVGAIIFLLKRRSLTAPEQKNTDPPEGRSRGS
jgi:hypothetical protein